MPSAVALNGMSTLIVNIRFLETFVWLAKLQSFRLTAEKLHTTQASVSSRIAALEKHFDVRLFERTTRAATITSAGRKMLAYAERIVRLDEEMKRDSSDYDGDCGIVRLGVIETIVHSWFPTLVSLIQERYPRVEIEVTSDTTVHLSELLRRESVELILQTGELSGAEFTNVALCEFPLCWVASPKLGLGHVPLDLPTLAHFRIVSFPRFSTPHAAIEQLFASASERPVRINCMTSIAAMIRLVSDGFGVAALPPWIIARELQEGTLERLDVAIALPSLSLAAVHRRQGKPIAPGIAALAHQAANQYLASLAGASKMDQTTRQTATHKQNESE